MLTGADRASWFGDGLSMGVIRLAVRSLPFRNPPLARADGGGNGVQADAAAAGS